MKWLDLAYAFVFFCNLLFMVGAIYVLLRVLDATEKSQINLQKAASQIIEVGTHIKVIVRRAFTEMERANDANAAKESNSGRAIKELSFQIKTLLDKLSASLKKAGAQAQPPDAAAQAEESGEELRAKLHAELNQALQKNHQLQAELEQVSNQLKNASSSNTEMREEFKEVKGVKQSVVDNLMKRSAELEAELEQARARAKAAEKLAETNAFQLDDIRAQISEQKFAASVEHIHQAAAPAADQGPAGLDQSELIQSQQDQIDVLSEREKALMARIAAIEGELSRNLDEKHFIEDRFLKLDAGGAPSANPPAGATE